MIRQGDTVTPFFNMGRRAVVLEVNEVKAKTWLVGSAIGKARVAKIQFADNNEIADYSVGDLMKVDD